MLEGVQFAFTAQWEGLIMGAKGRDLGRANDLFNPFGGGHGH